LERAGIPCGPINRLDQVFEDPQIQARKMKIDLPHPLAGTVPQVRAPLVFSRTTLDYDAAAPLLGQHTRSVLQARLGLDAATLDDLAARGVIEAGASADGASSRARSGNAA
ncbi:MAG: CoA transferase, partial [Betaproteobacteria bacterium]